MIVKVNDGLWVDLEHLRFIKKTYDGYRCDFEIGNELVTRFLNEDEGARLCTILDEKRSAELEALLKAEGITE